MYCVVQLRDEFTLFEVAVFAGFTAIVGLLLYE